MSTIKYAVKVPFENGKLYVTNNNHEDLQVLSFENYDDAVELAQMFGPNAEVVEFTGLKGKKNG